MATVTALTLKTTFWDAMGELYQGTATGGSTSTLTDTALIGYTSEVWPTKIVGQQLRMTGGLASGDLRVVGKFDPSDGIQYPNRNFSAATANTDTYELWGTAINGGTPLTVLLNAVLRRLRPVADTQVTIVTNQNQYDVTTIIQSKRDIRGVYLRNLDISGVAPYRPTQLARGWQWDAYDRGGAGTTSVVLELKTALTRDDNNIQLWVRAETGFTALVDDTSTVDAVYREWLAWEAVFELCQRRLALGNSDKSRWQALHDRALDEVSDGRNRWMPREPIEIAVPW